MTKVERIVQDNLNAYNHRDLEAFMASYSENIELWSYGKNTPNSKGKTSIRSFYQKIFEQSPQLHSKILSRIIFKNKIIDHEYITGRNGVEEAIEMVIIYEVEDDKIVKITTMKK